MLLVGAEQSSDLGFLGLPGCTLLVAPWAYFPATTDGAGRAELELPIPDDRNLVLARFACQWWITDPQAPRALPFTFSDGLRVVIGR